jgi:hypothetical protein
VTSEQIVRFFEDRPFVPFTIVTTDGRELNVRHPEQAHFGRRMEVVMFFFDDLRLDVIDSRLIVSLRTLQPVDINTYG